jgi:hypothetical protein
MDALTQAPPKRHGALAWTGAAAVSVAIFSAQFDWAPLLIAAWVVIAVVAIAAAVRGFAKRMATAGVQAGRVALAVAGTKVALVAFALWTLANAAWLLVLVYPDPRNNRVFAESTGIDLGSLLFPTLAACLAIGGWAWWALRSMGNADPARRLALRATCIAAPPTCLLLAVTPAIWIENFRSSWALFGADLPNPTLLVLAASEHWMVLPALSVALLLLAGFKRENATVFVAAVALQLCLLMLCGALMLLAVAAAWLPNFKLCAVV